MINKKIKKWLISFCLVGTILLPITIITSSCSSNTNESSTQDPNDPSIGPPPSDTPLNPEGGSFNNLNVNKYLQVIKLLNLNQKTVLSTLTSQKLTAQIQINKGFEQLTIDILDGSSELEGILRLSINGIYNNQPIKNANDIEITNFNKLSNRYFFNKIEINQPLWFDLKQPIKEKNNLPLTSNQQQIMQLLVKTSFILENENETYYLDNLPSFLKIKSIQWSLNKNDVDINLIFISQLKVYEQNQWVLKNNNQHDINILSNRNKSFALPTFIDLRQEMLNELSYNQTQIKKYYASYFYIDYLFKKKNTTEPYVISNILDAQFLISDFQTIINKYKSFYFNDIELAFEVLNLSSNDQNGSLTFSIVLVDLNQPENIETVRDFNFKGLKTTGINQKYTNTLFINDESKLKKFILNQYKTQINNAIEQNQIQISKITLTKEMLLLNIYNYETDAENENNKLANLKKDYSQLELFQNQLNLSLDNYQTKGTLILRKGQYFIDNGEENSFFIQNININYNEIKDILIEFKKNNQNGVDVLISTALEINLSNQTIYQPTELFLKILPSDLSPLFDK